MSDDDGVLNDRPGKPTKGWAGTSMQGNSPTEEVQRKRLEILITEYGKVCTSRAWLITCSSHAWRDLGTKHRVHPRSPDHGTRSCGRGRLQSRGTVL